jgi:opacity protein-like surface antigen
MILSIPARILCAAILVLAPTVASAEGFYVKLFGGASDLRGANTTLGGATGRASFYTGFIAGGAVGYAYAGLPIRAELEYAYRTSDATGLPAGIGTGDNFASTALMVNGIYDFQGTGGWRPYVGFGVGLLTEVDLDLTAPAGEYSDTGVPACQILLGAEYALNDLTSLYGEFRYLDAGSVDLAGPGGLLRTDYSSADLLLGVSFRF